MVATVSPMPSSNKDPIPIAGKEISLENTIDKDILGGFNLKIGDKMIDCSVSSKINELRKKLINN